MLAYKWFYVFMTRPKMSMKVERELHDIRIWAELWKHEVRNNSLAFCVNIGIYFLLENFMYLIDRKHKMWKDREEDIRTELL